MRIDGPTKDLTADQKRQADIAGVPANRPGLGDEYPKMIYRPGENPRHMHMGEPLLIGNGSYNERAERLSEGYECETAFVDSAEDEAQALEDGWFLSPFPDLQEKQAAKMEASRDKDNRIAELEAQLAAQNDKRGPGRPRLSVSDTE